MMKIGLNLIHANKSIGGVWDYIKGVLSALSEHSSDQTFICYCTSQSECLIPQKSNFKKNFIGIHGSNRIKRILYENTILSLRAYKDRLDCMHWFANTLGFFCSVPSVVTIYDLLGFEQTESLSFMRRLYVKSMLPRTVRLADIIAPMSQSTSESLVRILKADVDRMIVIPPIIRDEFSPKGKKEIEIFRQKYGLPSEFWLYVAHFYPHKNHHRLFQAYAKWKKNCTFKWPLVLRGEKNNSDEYIYRLLEDVGIQEDVIWLPRLNDGEMPLLYSSASAMIFPSTYEGGGIPVMEALACGCPLVASKIPTNIEFAGDAAFFFDPLDVDSIAEAMVNFSLNSEFRDMHIQLGKDMVQRLRSRNVSQLLIKAYKRSCKIKGL